MRYLLYTVFITFPFWREAYAQVPVPEKNIIQAYFDDNYGFIKNAVQKDGFDFSYLQTSYKQNNKVADFVSISKNLRYSKFNCEIYRENSSVVVNVRSKVLLFPKEDVTIWFAEQANIEGNVFTSVLHTSHAIQQVKRPVPSWVTEFIGQNNYKLIGTDLEALRRVANSKFDENVSHLLMFSIKGNDGFHLKIALNIYQYLKDYYGKQPEPYSTMQDNWLTIEGDEYSISKFLSMPNNSIWTSIKCDTDGLHTYIPVSIAGSSYSYILDTGASFITITKKQAKELELVGEGQMLDTYVDLQIADGSFIKAQKMAISELKIGSITLNNVLAIISDSGVPLLGMSVLKKFEKWEITNDGSWLRVKKL